MKPMKLTKIDKKELLFSEEIENSQTNTYMTVNDYDWMTYSIKTSFLTKKLGRLNIEFQYSGYTTSHMKVDIVSKNKIETIYYRYPTDIFKKYIIRFMKEHIAAWEDQYAFNGEDIVLDFYNEVIEKGSLLPKEGVF